MSTHSKATLAAELQALVDWIESVRPALRHAASVASGQSLRISLEQIERQAESNASHAAKILAAQ